MKIFRLWTLLILMPSYAISQNQAKVDSLQKILKTDISDKQKVQTHNLIAHEYRNTDSALVVHHTRIAIALANKINYPKSVADAYYSLGWITMQKGNYSQAIKLYQQARKIAKKNNYLKGIANAYNGIGVAYNYQGINDKSLKYYYLSLEIKKKTNDRMGIATSYNNIAMVYSDQDNYPKALELYQKSLTIAREIGFKKGIAFRYNNMGDVYRKQGNYPKALAFLQNALKINLEIGDKRGIALNHNGIGEVYRKQGNYPKALAALQKALKIGEETGNRSEITAVYSNIGLIYLSQKNYLPALRFFRKALSMGQLIGQQEITANSWVNIGIIHYHQKAPNKAINFLEKGVKTARQTGFPYIVRDGTKYLAEVYHVIDKPRLAYKNHVLFKQMADSLLNAKSIRKIAELEYLHSSEKKEDSLQQVQHRAAARRKALRRAQRINFMGASAVMLIVFLSFYYYKQRSHSQRLGKANEAIARQQTELHIQHSYLEQAYQNVQLLAVIGQKITASLDLDKVLETIYEHVNQLMNVTNFGIGIYEPKSQQIVFKLAMIKGIRKDGYTFDTAEKNQLMVWCIENNQPVKMGDIPNEYHQYIDNIETESQLLLKEGSVPFSIIFIPLVIKEEVIGLLAVQSHQKHAYTDHHFDLLKNLSLYVATAIYNAQVYDQLDKKNKDMMGGINYAQRIQRAMLPLDDDLRRLIPEHFVMHRPLEIVSGDFYWCEEDHNKVFLAVGDCTGHGVPGAFMTILGIQALNHLVIQNKITAPDLVLFCMDCILRQILKSDDTMIRDGMDIVLVVIDKQRKELQYAGAVNPLIVVQNGDIQEIKGDMYSINGHLQANDGIEFTTHRIDISEPTMLYMYSDGYRDQFGGNKGKKFMKKRLLELLFEISEKPMQEQKLLLENTLDEWMDGREQIDDILVMGVQLTMSH